MRLSGRTALITGGGSGIGLAIAKAVIAEGASVAIAGNESDQIDSAQERLAEADNRTRGYVMDVRSEREVEDTVRRCVADLGAIDILVNSAGVTTNGPTVTSDPADWSRVIDTNLTGTYRATVATLHLSGMLERRWGRVINISSIAGKQGALLSAAYTASKHGVVGLTRSLGRELAQTGVTVNAICPGFVDTEMERASRQTFASLWGLSDDVVKDRFLARVPLGRYLDPAEIAPLAVYLASDDSAAVIGQAWNICGGLGTY